MIEKDADQIKLDVSSVSKTNIEVVLSRIDGKVISSRKYDVAEGTQQLNFDIPLISAGNYMLNVRSLDNQINEHVRISKL